MKAQLKRVRDLLRQKKARVATKLVAVEGDVVIEELAKHFPLQTLLTTKPTTLQAKDFFTISKSQMEQIATTRTPPTMIATLPLPEETSLRGKKRLVALDRLQDPGNVGTLFRTALALGWEGIFLVEPICDPFNEKALRAAKGATFHLPFQRATWNKIHQFCQEEGHTLLAAELQGDLPEKQNKPCVLALGHEGAGLCKELQAKAVSIPMQSTSESLNVAIAGGILLYVL